MIIMMMMATTMTIMMMRRSRRRRAKMRIVVMIAVMLTFPTPVSSHNPPLHPTIFLSKLEFNARGERSGDVSP